MTETKATEAACPMCEGQGRIPLGEHFVTRYMAMDACAPEMEGMSMGIEYGQCEFCGGDGKLPIFQKELLEE